MFGGEFWVPAAAGHGLRLRHGFIQPAQTQHHKRVPAHKGVPYFQAAQLLAAQHNNRHVAGGGRGQRHRRRRFQRYDASAVGWRLLWSRRRFQPQQFAVGDGPGARRRVGGFRGCVHSRPRQPRRHLVLDGQGRRRLAVAAAVAGVRLRRQPGRRRDAQRQGASGFGFGGAGGEGNLHQRRQHSRRTHEFTAGLHRAADEIVPADVFVPHLDTQRRGAVVQHLVPLQRQCFSGAAVAPHRVRPAVLHRRGPGFGVHVPRGVLKHQLHVRVLLPKRFPVA